MWDRQSHKEIYASSLFMSHGFCCIISLNPLTLGQADLIKILKHTHNATSLIIEPQTLFKPGIKAHSLR